MYVSFNANKKLKQTKQRKSANLLIMLNNAASIQTHTVPVYYNTVASCHTILHSRRYWRPVMSPMTSHHPLVPHRVQLTSTQTQLAGWRPINTSCPTVNDAPWSSSRQQRFLQSPLTDWKQGKLHSTHGLSFTIDLAPLLVFLQFLIVLGHGTI